MIFVAESLALTANRTVAHHFQAFPELNSDACMNAGFREQIIGMLGGTVTLFNTNIRFA
jgi:hypothetical protein